MKQILYNYDIFPKVFLGNREKTITIQPLGDHASFKACHEYTIKVFKVDQSNPAVYPERSGRTTLTAAPEADGNLRFTAFFEGEGEHFVNVYDEPEGKPRFTLSLYSLNEDMAGRIPYRGDLHMHTCRSDGKEAPSAVCANYRGHGYDFFAITDHRRFYPSLEAIEMYKDITDFNIVPGEEVHLPLNNVHYVNFGSTFSINALVTPNCNQEKAGDDLSFRSTNGNAPDTMTEEEFIAMIEKRSEKVNREHKSERLSYAVLEWTYEQVQKGGGLGIFPHPYWLCQMMQLPEDYTEFIYKNAPFDAFEVLGGENYYQHNGLQTARYYADRANGIRNPIVGSTDSHNSIPEANRNALICSTFVFATENERTALISAIKDMYSVAVDTISTEYRLVGDMRLVKYTRFLLDEFTPLHDDLCFEEGRLMKAAVTGDEDAKATLRFLHGRMQKLYNKYFAL